MERKKWMEKESGLLTANVVGKSRKVSRDSLRLVESLQKKRLEGEWQGSLWNAGYNNPLTAICYGNSGRT